MAVAFDAKATANSATSGTTVVTLSNANMTVGSGSNRALICVVTWESVAAPTSISAKWDTAGTNQTMAQIGSTISNGNFRVALFGLLAPTSGAKNFTLSWTNTASCYLDLIAFTGVDQTSNAVAFPHFNSATGTSVGPATVNITSATGNYTVASFVAGPAGDLTTLNQTVLYGPDITDPNMSGAANYAIGAASNTHSCTVSASVAWAVCGVDVLASGTATVNAVDPVEWRRLTPKTHPAYTAQFIAFTPLAKEDVARLEWTTIWCEPVRAKPGLPPHEQSFLAFPGTFPDFGVLFDTKSTSSITGAGVTSFTDNTKMTVGTGLNRGLVVEVCLSGAPTAVTVTWNGVSMTQLVSLTDGGSNTTTQLYGLRNPASGTQTLAGSWTGAASVVASAVSFTNVDQNSDALAFRNATSATGGTSPASVTVTSAVGNKVVAAHSTTLATFQAINNIPLFSTLNGSFAGAGNYAFGAASTLMAANFTTISHTWTSVGVDVNPPSQIPWLVAFNNPVARSGFAAHQQSFSTGSLFPITTVVTPYAGWDDILEWPRPAPPRSTAYSAPFLAQVLGAFQSRDSALEELANWPDFVPGRPRVPLHQPWSFVPPPAQVFFPYSPWDDFARAAKRVAQQQDWSYGTFVTPSFIPTWTQWTQWPDFATRQRPTASFTPWTFIEPAPQVWFPYAPWDDFTRRKPQPLDTQPLAWPPTPIVAPFPAMGWINWPDFAPKPRRGNEFLPWAFIPTPAQVFFPYAPWDDFTRRKPQPLDTQPLAFVSVVVAAAAQVWYPPNTWPDFAPKARPAIDTNWLALVSPVPTATVIGDWPDFVRRKPQPIDTQPLSWTGQTIAVQQVWFPYDPWPSLIAKKPVPLIFTPATPFIQTPAQVFFPYGPWDDFARRQRPAIDTQQLAWSNFTPAPTFFFVPNNWPDFAAKTRLLVDLRPWSFIPSPVQVWFPYGPWDDFARRKPSSLIYPPTTLVPIHVPTLGYLQWPDFATKKRPPLDYIPLTFVQTIRTPWNELSRWPEMVPIRSKAGLHAALQQFAARFPGTISQATITGILSAFEVNSDVASITIFVRQSGPAVRAAVSIQEIGTI